MSDLIHEQIREEHRKINACNLRIRELERQAMQYHRDLFDQFRDATVHMLNSGQAMAIARLPRFANRMTPQEVIEVRTDHMRQRALVAYIAGVQPFTAGCEEADYWEVMRILNGTGQ